MTTVTATVTLATNDVNAPPLEAGEVATVDETDPYIAGLITGGYLAQRGSTPDTDWVATA